MQTFKILTTATKPFQGQKPGTSGLRKKTKEFLQDNYLANFVQSTFDVLKDDPSKFPSVLVVGGDGRYFCKEAAHEIIAVAAANGVKRVWVGQDSILSTPAVSAVIRRRSGGFVAQGAFILTASHNPGGLDADFGIKYNGSNGGPASESLTNLVYQQTIKIEEIKKADIPLIDLGIKGLHQFVSEGGAPFEVEVIDSTDDYAALLRDDVFDFDRLKAFLKRGNFRLFVDCLNGVAGPYARRIFYDELQASPELVVVANATPLPDFGGLHPDPNLSYAEHLVATMGLLPSGQPSGAGSAFDMGVALDGDADRNMILGREVFVSPSDSVAIIAAHAEKIPFFSRQGGLKCVARSMPTSRALDHVARERGIALAEVPTGWKFFGNLMDSKCLFGGKEYTPLICGEESFGTGSNHIREKDGLWAALAWLSIIDQSTAGGPASIASLVDGHWRHFGRNVYSRYDYEGVSTESADRVMAHVLSLKPCDVDAFEGEACVELDSFTYLDPVDGSKSANQGARVLFKGGSRFVVRLSGTGSSGATIRLYLEKYMPPSEDFCTPTEVVLADLVRIALKATCIESFTGMKTPTVIT